MTSQFIEIEFDTLPQLAAFAEGITCARLTAAYGTPWNDDRLRALVDARSESIVKTLADEHGGRITGVKEIV